MTGNIVNTPQRPPAAWPFPPLTNLPPNHTPERRARQKRPVSVTGEVAPADGRQRAEQEVAHVTPNIADDRGERGQLHRS